MEHGRCNCCKLNRIESAYRPDDD